jgi:hypothetical protein
VILNLSMAGCLHCCHEYRCGDGSSQDLE